MSEGEIDPGEDPFQFLPRTTCGSVPVDPFQMRAAPLGDDGLYYLEVQGTFGSPKLLARTCGAPAKP